MSQAIPVAAPVQDNSFEDDSGVCKTICGWFVQIIFGWGAIAFLVLGIVTKNTNFYIFAGVAYVVYLIAMFCSTTCSYLRHKGDSLSIYDTMKALYKTGPTINFYAQCYHYEWRTVHTGRKGHRRTTRRRRRRNE